MAIYEAILADHAKTRRMLRELSEVGEAEPERRIALFADLKSALTIHQHAEEAVFYERLKGMGEMRSHAHDAINEHRVLEALLNELAEMAKGNERWTAKLGALRELVEHHMEEEEGEFFERARAIVDEGLAARMGEEFRRKKCAGIEALTPLGWD
jgi:hemerythrin superfamily protein